MDLQISEIESFDEFVRRTWTHTMLGNFTKFDNWLEYFAAYLSEKNNILVLSQASSAQGWK